MKQCGMLVRETGLTGKNLSQSIIFVYHKFHLDPLGFEPGLAVRKANTLVVPLTVHHTPVFVKFVNFPKRLFSVPELLAENINRQSYGRAKNDEDDFQICNKDCINFVSFRHAAKQSL